MSDLEIFRKETRQWVEANCPASQRVPFKDWHELYWGGKNSEFATKDQQLWFERMLDKKWIVPH